MHTLSLSEALLEEVNHRAANSLQLAASLLHCYAREAESNPVQHKLLTAANQLFAMGLVHRRLCQSSDADRVDLRNYLHTLVAEIQATVPYGRNLCMTFVAEENELLVVPTLATRLGLIVTELLMNCVKYAKASDTCSVKLEKTLDILTLEVRDDGPGLPQGIGASYGGVGMHLAQSLCSSLGGTLAFPRITGGACIVVRIPVSGNGERTVEDADGEKKTAPPVTNPYCKAQRGHEIDASRSAAPPVGDGCPMSIAPPDTRPSQPEAELYETDYCLLLANEAAEQDAIFLRQLGAANARRVGVQS
jgi:two-component sensor histidine kinase